MELLSTGGIIAIVVLLIVFEICYGSFGKRTHNRGYDYYTADDSCVRIQHAWGTLYKIYVYGHSPVDTKHDKRGHYFTIRATSEGDAEQIVDNLFRAKEADM